MYPVGPNCVCIIWWTDSITDGIAGKLVSTGAESNFVLPVDDTIISK